MTKIWLLVNGYIVPPVPLTFTNSTVPSGTAARPTLTLTVMSDSVG